VTQKDVENIINWEITSQNQTEIPFMAARVLLQVLSIFMSSWSFFI
jgi:aconitase A